MQRRSRCAHIIAEQPLSATNRTLITTQKCADHVFSPFALVELSLSWRVANPSDEVASQRNTHRTRKWTCDQRGLIVSALGESFRVKWNRDHTIDPRHLRAHARERSS